MTTLAVLDAPLVGGGAALPLEPPTKGAFAVPKYSRVDAAGKFAILINEGCGWLAMTPEKTLHNPWTKAPFRELCDCKKAVKFWLKHGRWPKRRDKISDPVLSAHHPPQP